ncbi:MAG: TonB-dependent receptor [Bacteroidales bacterium]|nr:TonB-dependent receptor [Bacteroidales bacterium]
MNSRIRYYQTINRVILILVIFVTYSNIVIAQENNYFDGYLISSDGRPIEYANIYVKGRTSGIITDSTGHFKLNISSCSNVDTIIISCIGFQGKILPLKDIKDFKIGKIELETKTNDIKEVVVEASRYSTGDQRKSTLKTLEMLQIPGSSGDSFGALKVFPGIQEVSEGSGLFIRGGDQSETAIILDGAYLYHPYRFESPNGGYYGIMSSFQLQNTSFSTGGFGTEYGNSMSGILDMKSVDLLDDKMLDMNIGLAGVGIRLGKPFLDNKMSLLVSANYSDTKYLFKLNGNTSKTFLTYPTSSDFNVNWFYKYSRTGSLKIFYLNEGDQINVSINSPNVPSNFGGKNRNNFINLCWYQSVNSKIIFRGNLAYSYYKSLSEISNLGLNLNSINKMYQALGSMTYFFNNKISSSIGLNFFSNREVSEGDFSTEPGQIISPYEYKNWDLKYLSNRMAIYNKWVWKFLKKNNLSFGLRYENESKSNENIIDFRSSLKINLLKNIDLVASVGKYHQFLDPKYYSSDIKNRNLIAQYSNHYVLGISRENEDLLFRLEFYFKDYKNLLLNDTSLNYNNNGYGYAKGVDLFLKKKFMKLNCMLSLSYLNTKRNWFDSPYLAPTEFDIRWTFTNTIEYNITNSWYLGLKDRFATGKPYTSNQFEYHNARVRYYNVLDASMNYKISFKKSNLNVIYIAINNILGRQNIFGYRYSDDYSERVPISSTMLRNIYFGINVSF